MLRLHKGYSISFSAGVTKKLTQQYVGPFCILEKVGRLVYKLDVPQDWRVYLVFLVAHLEPAPALTDNLFYRPRPHKPPAVFVDGDTNTAKSFKVDCLVKKRIVKKGKGRAVEYIVYWTGYGPKWDRWYNIKDLNNAADFVRDYEEALAQQEH